MSVAHKYVVSAVLILTLFSMLSPTASASNAWYKGVVTSVSLIVDDSFVITFNTTTLSDCKYSYAYFKAGQIGVDIAKQAYTMAMTSLVTGRIMGVVIDKNINGSGGECDTTGMVASLQ